MTRRRGLLEKVFACAILIQSSLFSLQLFAASQGPASQSSLLDAIGLVRTINGLQSTFLAKHGVYATKSEILGSEGLAGFVQQHTSSSLAWLHKVNLDSDEILPGLVLDFASKPSGYVLTLSEKQADPTVYRNVFITDQNAIIYRATLAGEAPRARDLTGASVFPGAKPHNEFPGLSQ